MVWVGVFVTVLVASTAQTLAGFGYALIATPLVAVLVGPREAVVGLTLSGVVLVALLGFRGRGSVDRRSVLVITVAAALAMPLGVLFLRSADERLLTAAIAVAVIAFALLMARGFRLPDRSSSDAAAGFAAGLLSTSTGTSGPPIVIALSSKRMTPSAFRATISTIFLVQAGVGVVVFAAAGQVTRGAVSVALAGLPGVVLGTAVGERGFRRLDAAAFRRVVLAMLLLSGVVALIGALAS
jgi:hypothetical protein